MRIATVADAVPLRCVLATGPALASVIVTPFSPRPPVAKTRPAG